MAMAVMPAGSLALGAAILVLAVGGCGSEDEPSGEPLRVDERAGTVNGVGLGDDRAAIVAEFGEPGPDRQRDPVTPLEVDPGDVTHPRPSTGGPPGPIRALRYPGVSFILVGGRTLEVIVASTEASTRRGLTPGDDIRRAAELYDEIRCGKTDVGVDFSRYEAACWARMGGNRYFWIGGDPINNLRMSATPLRPLG